MRYLAYHENVTHGTAGFPVQLYCVDDKNPRYEMPFHWHVQCEFIYVLQGEFTLSLDGENITIKAQQCAFAPGGVIHGGTPHNCIYRCLVVDMEQLLQNNPLCLQIFQKQLLGGANIIKLFEKAQCEATGLVQMFDVMEKWQEGCEFAVTGLLWQWLGNILQKKLYTKNDGQARQQYKRSEEIKCVFRRIRNEYSHTLTLQQLADDAGLNKQYFCKVFKELTGRTPIDYLNYYRIECAAELLCTTQESITEIALACGFSDLSYFNRLFKKIRGENPSSYRNKLKNQGKS